MDVFELRKRVTQEYSDYITSFFSIHDPRIKARVEEEFQAGRLWPSPLVQLNPSFEPGTPIDELIAEDVLHPECRHIFRVKTETGAPGPVFRFHKHQEEAVRLAARGHNYVLTTGTGSGKSLSYMAPIVDHVLRHGSGKGIKAVIIYPMNALANSQAGELRKFLEWGYGDQPPVTFAIYTGQEDEKAKQEVISNPPDILLTNYVMLEYILVRPKERPLVRTMNNLRFLVLDELHTYRGRQGADVALLVRRLRGASGTPHLQMIGTSATLAGKGSWPHQQKETAGVASKLFGAEVKPEHVIGETLRSKTADVKVDHAGFHAALREVYGKPFPSGVESLRNHPLVCWVDARLGLEWDQESNRYRRCTPRPIEGKNGLATLLTRLVDISEAQAADWLYQLLMHPTEPHGQPFFAFRLHQFLAKGETVYASPELPELRFLTLNAQQFVPDGKRDKELFPLAFCRECGQEYYTVHRLEKEGVLDCFLPRSLGDRSGEDDAARNNLREPGFLVIGEGVWPENPDEQLAHLPEPWLEEKKGRTVVRSRQKNFLPRTERINAHGKPDPKGTAVLWLKRPFRFCLRCHVAFETRGSDFARLATLGSEGRSTATTITTKTALRFLKEEKSLVKEARKLLSFTDNRQDASLQTGHFNDFLQVLQIRCGLYQALCAAPQGLRYRDLNLAVFNALNLPFPAYAADPMVKYGRDEVAAKFREVLGYLLFRDLERGWRINSPNLEQCGLLCFDYSYLDMLCADNTDWSHTEGDPEWSEADVILAGASPAERKTVCRVLLDYLRRELVINAQPLDHVYQESIPKDSQDLTATWSIAQMETMVLSKVAYPRPKGDDGRRRRKGRVKEHLYLSERGSFGRYLRRSGTFADQPKPAMAETRKMIQKICNRLAMAGILRVVDPADEDPGYQLDAGHLIWCKGEGERRNEDPIRIPSAPDGTLKPNPYFLSLYRSGVEDLQQLHAAEHTAQVPPDLRVEREKRFSAADLSLMFCSPTMELGVDIKDLNVVNMRNVPPTPANYAQRSGRAGRSGQAAFVFTYCTSGSPHDSYFFRRPGLMVSGQVKPPRLDLVNEDLVRAHVHAIWLHVAGLELHASLQELLDLSGSPPNPRVLPDVARRLCDPVIARKTFAASMLALGQVIEALAEHQQRTPEEWLDGVLAAVPASFEAACARWRELYIAAWQQSERQSRVVRDSSRSADDRKRARNLRDDAELRLRLLLETTEKNNNDFYSYRYFAGEGFLPGYNFPRLPITAFLRGRRESRNEDDALSRPRFLAISEFGPRAIIYHEGSRYMINRVDIPIGHEGGDPTSTAQQCLDCGYMHPPRDEKGSDACDHCGEANLHLFTNLFRMQNVGTRRRDRINSDEEERTRLGYILKVGVRFPHREGRRDSRKARLLDEHGKALLELEYGSSATIWRMSLGWRHARNKDHQGFLLDVERGYWGRANQDEDPEPEDPMSKSVQRVIPYVEDTRNSLLVKPVQTASLEEMATLQAALKHALQVQYQIEDRELSVEALPSAEDRRMLLFYESAEGGAGVLRRLLDSAFDLADIAKLALELAHYRVEGNMVVDLGRPEGVAEDCVAACYDCLLSYFNQPDHRRIDRTLLPRLLKPWLRARVDASPVPLSREEHLRRLLRLCASDLERSWLNKLGAEGYHLPNKAQILVREAACRPDFLYSDPHTRVAVFIDGPHHDLQKAKDAELDEVLDDVGWTPVRFHYKADWDAILARYPSCFGQPKAQPEAPHLEPEALPADGFDPEEYDEIWRPLMTRLNQLPDMCVAGGEEYEREGRTIGLSVAVCTYKGRSLVLLEADDPDREPLSAYLTEEGVATLVLQAGGQDPYAEILALLVGHGG